MDTKILTAVLIALVLGIYSGNVLIMNTVTLFKEKAQLSASEFENTLKNVENEILEFTVLSPLTSPPS